jgi:hypothetical protein
MDYTRARITHTRQSSRASPASPAHPREPSRRQPSRRVHARATRRAHASRVTHATRRSTIDVFSRRLSRTCISLLVERAGVTRARRSTRRRRSRMRGRAPTPPVTCRPHEKTPRGIRRVTTGEWDHSRRRKKDGVGAHTESRSVEESIHGRGHKVEWNAVGRTFGARRSIASIRFESSIRVVESSRGWMFFIDDAIDRRDDL